LDGSLYHSPTLSLSHPSSSFASPLSTVYRIIPAILIVFANPGLDTVYYVPYFLSIPFITAKRACKPNIRSPPPLSLNFSFSIRLLFLFGFRSFAIVFLCYYYYLLSRPFCYSIAMSPTYVHISCFFFFLLFYLLSSFFF